MIPPSWPGTPRDLRSRSPGRGIVCMWWQPRSSRPRPAGTRQYPPGLLRPKKAQVWPTTGSEAAVWWRRSCYLRPRPAGTRVRCTAQTCYASFSIDLWLQRGASQPIHILHTHAKDDTLDHLTWSTRRIYATQPLV